MIFRHGWWIQHAGESYDKPARLSHGKHALHSIRSTLQRRGTAIDCGAHYGTWSLPMARMFKHVQSFEANPANFECLTANVGWIDNVDIFNAALGDRADSVTVDFAHETWRGNTGIKAVLGPGPTPMVTIDSLNCTSLDFLKIDVEGYELFVLRGAEQTLRTYRPVILLEEIKVHCDRYHLPLGSCRKFLASLGAKQSAKIGNNFLFTWPR